MHKSILSFGRFFLLNRHTIPNELAWILFILGCQRIEHDILVDLGLNICVYECIGSTDVDQVFHHNLLLLFSTDVQRALCRL